MMEPKKSATMLQKIDGELIEELKGIITEGVFNSRWTLIEAYWQLGKLLTEKAKELPKGYVRALAPELKVKERLLYQTIQFYKAYPDLSKLPMGKNISWHRIANNLLPAHKETKISPEERLAEKIEAFFKVKNVDRKTQTIAWQLIEEWENFKRNK
jgi:hypothetical protein